MKAKIHFSRIGKKEALYIEDLVLDDGIKLVTHSIIPRQYRRVWAKEAWIQQGIMSAGEIVFEVRKHHFYNEWFDVIELFDSSSRLIGYYCDVITPLRKVDGEYYLLDLMLDLWIFPDGRTIELDWDEFDAASRNGMLSQEQQRIAIETLSQMVAAVKQGIFPARYINSPTPGLSQSADSPDRLSDVSE